MAVVKVAQDGGGATAVSPQDSIAWATERFLSVQVVTPGGNWLEVQTNKGAASLSTTCQMTPGQGNCCKRPTRSFRRTEPGRAVGTFEADPLASR
jgi:hypothetical protein